MNGAFGDCRRVLHVVGSALSPTETFVLRQLEGSRYVPSLMAWSRAPNSLPLPCPTRIVRFGRSTRLMPRLRWATSGARLFDSLGAVLMSRADVVHAHFGNTATRILPYCRLLRKPLVVSFYGFDVGQVARDARSRRSYARLCRWGAAFTAEGPVLARRLMALGASPRSVKLLPLSLPDWALHAPERTVDWHEPGLRLIQVARFVEKKGVDTVLRALAIARQRGVNASLDLVGDGPLRGQLETLARELDLGASLRWHGLLGAGELPSLFARTHALVQPSRTGRNGDTEGGHPTVIIEAQACGLPCLATRHADIPSVVAHAETGILVDESAAPDALARSIETVHHQRERLAAMGQNAREYVLRRHHPERLLRIRERIYREALRRFDQRPLGTLWENPR